MNYIFLRYPEGRSKAITLSYDDNCTADRKLVSILNKYNIKCTFNLNSGIFSNAKEKGIVPQEISELFLHNGHEIAIHGEYHKASGLVSPKDGICDVLNCRKDLENITGTIIRGMAYPDCGIRRLQNGMSKNEIGTYLKQLGIAYSRTLGNDNDDFFLPTNWYEWIPTAYHLNNSLFEYLQKFLDSDTEKKYVSYKQPLLFYLWGHAFELENNKSWDIIEQFCEKSAFNKDIWYATNIEIYDYVTAYNSLIFSIDNKIIYNPSVIDVWIEKSDEIICIKSGETVYA